MTRPICHRALHNQSQAVIENSWEAIEAGLKRGLPLEIDVQNTKDGRTVVFHDADLARLTGAAGLVCEKTLAEMEALPLLGGGTVLGFADVLKRVAGRVPLLVEIKDQDGALGPQLGSFLPDIVEAVAGYQGAVALMSFNPYVMKGLRAELPEVPMGLVTCNFSRRDWPNVPKERRKRLREMREVPFAFDFVSHDWTDLWRVRKLERPVLCWTVKARWQEFLARWVADNVTFENYWPKGA